MPVTQKKIGQGRNETLQAKPSDFTRYGASKEPTANTEVMDSDEAVACLTPQDMTLDENVDKEPGPTLITILTAIKNMKREFSAKFDGILSAIESLRQSLRY